MPQPKGRDLEQTGQRLASWLADRMSGARGIRIEDLRGPKDTGFSSDTLMFTLHADEGAAPVRRDLVVRLEPISDFGVFPEYDVVLQYRMMDALADTAVPVPRMVWLEESATPLGSPFYVMERVDGQVPSDSPPYHAEGWIAELLPERRERLWYSGLDAMADVHRLDPADPRFSFLRRPATGQSPIGAQLDYWQHYLDWGMDRARYPLIERGLEWLVANAPAREPAGICWGDARISNQIFRDCEAVAVIDWEMVFVGNPVADLAWFVTIDRVFTEGIGLPRLPGLPDRKATIRRWEERVGRPAEHFDYYEVFAAWRFAVIMARVFLQMKHYEVLPADAQVDVVNLSSPILETVLAEVGA